MAACPRSPEAHSLSGSSEKQAFTNISKMQLMEREATGVLVCNVVFLVIMNGGYFLVRELGTDIFHVWNFICSTYNHSSNISTSGIGLKY